VKTDVGDMGTGEKGAAEEIPSLKLGWLYIELRTFQACLAREPHVRAEGGALSSQLKYIKPSSVETQCLFPMRFVPSVNEYAFK